MAPAGAWKIMAPNGAAHSRRLPGLILAIAVAGAAAFSVRWDWVESLEDHTVDFRFQQRGGRGGPVDSVIVGIADSTLTLAERSGADLLQREPRLAAIAAPFPWNRRVYAEVIRTLRAAGARAIVFDLLFDAANEGDEELARALAEPGAPVVLASLTMRAQEADRSSHIKVHRPQEALAAAARDRVGFADVFPDPDGVVRQLTVTKLQTELDGQPPIQGEPSLPSLAMAAWQATTTGERGAPDAGYIDFMGPSGSIPARAMEDLFDPGRRAAAFGDTGVDLRGKVVWVGGLSEVLFKDIFITPLGRMAGVEVQAQAYETLRSRSALREPAPWARVASVWGLAAAGLTLAGLVRRISRQLALLALGVLGWAVLAQAWFSLGGLVLPMVAPLATWMLVGGCGVGGRFIMEQRERRRLRGMLGRYVSEEVAQIIVAQPEEFSQALRGGRRPVTVLFADLRGFTAWVEQVAPETFVAQLNEYFGAVVDCVLGHGGTLQKFIGDAVLTVWGDTRTAGPTEDTARAIDAALAMQTAVAKLNGAWAGRPDRTPMAIGIGLHQGVAMVGNVGHAQRMEFTVLGDVVNVAARLESANRQLGTTLLVSETIRDLIRGTHRCVALGRFGLKGRREAVGLFVPLGRKSGAEPEWLAAAERTLAAWTAGEFAVAAAGYAELAQRPTPLREFFELQARRAQAFAAEPPADWQGEYRLDSK